MLLQKLKICTTQDELYTIYVRTLLLLYGIRLQTKVETVLRYFIQYGLTNATHEKILEDHIVPTMQSISNAKTTLLDAGLIVKKPKWRMATGLENIKIEDILDIVLKCKIQDK